jgi:hypothetical protein
MGRKNKIVLGVLAVVLLVGAGGWYLHKRSTCIENIFFVPATSSGTFGNPTAEYYDLLKVYSEADVSVSRHKTFEEAMRKCMSL